MDGLHRQFLSLLLPIENHASIYFRRLRCPHKKEDAVQEMRAIAWKWLVRLKASDMSSSDPQLDVRHRLDEHGLHGFLHGLGDGALCRLLDR
jgi:hypothetical protein